MPSKTNGNVRAVLFDLDETLFNRTESLRLFLKGQGAKYPTLQSVSLSDLTDHFLLLDQRGRVKKDTVYRKLLEILGRPDDRLAATLLHDYETNFWRFALPFPEMEGVLSALKQQSVKIAIVTNGQTHIQLRSILALNLDRVADAYLISEQEQVRKPDPVLFHRAATRLNVDIERSVFVGDSPEADIVGAHQTGMKTIWFPNGTVWPGNLPKVADAEISSLSEIPELISKWYREGNGAE